MWRVVCLRRTNRFPHAYLSTLKQGSRDEATIQNEFLGYNFNGKIKNKISRDHESEQTTKFMPSSKTSLELHQFRGTQMWRVVCPRRINRLSHWHTSPHSNKVLETKQNNLKRVLRFWWCQPRLSNQVGVNNCFLSKLQSFSVHMMMCESSTAASLRSNICHLFPSKSWKWCLNFFLSFLFFLFMIANWPGKFLARTSHILWCSNSELLNAQTFKEPHSSIIKRDFAFPTHKEKKVLWVSILYGCISFGLTADGVCEGYLHQAQLFLLRTFLV